MEIARLRIDERFVVPKDTEKILRLKFGYNNRDNATYHEVVDWLERFFDKYVSVSVGFNFHTQRMEYCGQLTTATGEWSSENFPTREEALNAAILKALEMI